ncbi:hypothetical protein [Halomonas denitrificans]|nr:hypothetical protein [Halomonas denitrificans]
MRQTKQGAKRIRCSRPNTER